MFTVTRLKSLSGYSVTYSEHNRLAINPNFNNIHHTDFACYSLVWYCVLNYFIPRQSNDINVQLLSKIFVKGIWHLNVYNDGGKNIRRLHQTLMQGLFFLSAAKYHIEEFRFSFPLLHPSWSISGRSVGAAVKFTFLFDGCTVGAGGQKRRARPFPWAASFLGAFLPHQCGHHRADSPLQAAWIV